MSGADADPDEALLVGAGGAWPQHVSRASWWDEITRTKSVTLEPLSVTTSESLAWKEAEMMRRGAEADTLSSNLRTVCKRR